MTPNQIKWALWLAPPLVIGTVETVRTTLVEPYIPSTIGNWLTALTAATVIALVSQQLFVQFEKTQHDLRQEREKRAVIEERERVAKSLHDQLAQSIFFAGVQLQSLSPRTDGAHDDAASALLDDVLVSLREIDEDVRQAIFNQKGQPDRGMGFSDRVRDYVTEFTSETGIPCDLKLETLSPPLSAAEEVELFGILQESLANVRKHARASSVRVALERAGSSGGWHFVVRDDGVGFEHGAGTEHHYGLKMIAHRASDIGACMSVHSHLGVGTEIAVEKRAQIEPPAH